MDSRTDVAGNVFNLERYAIHDGPGIRTQVFFKGCPLRCLWCSNPEGMSFGPNLMYTRLLCIACGACVSACPRDALQLTGEGLQIDRSKCDLCGECVNGCTSQALELNSSVVTVAQIVDEVERDRVFYEVSGGGGVTLCGGEALAQPAFALELLKQCKARGVHTAIETCGCCPFEALEQAIRYLDFIFFDIKHMDAAEHRSLTEAGNAVILDNLRKLQAFNVPIVVRVPVIPTLNDSTENMEAIAAFVATLPKVRAVELLPYHRLGAGKYRKLGVDYPLDAIAAPSPAAMQKVKAIFDRRGVACIVQP